MGMSNSAESCGDPGEVGKASRDKTKFLMMVLNCYLFEIEDTVKLYILVLFVLIHNVTFSFLHFLRFQADFKHILFLNFIKWNF